MPKIYNMNENIQKYHMVKKRKMLLISQSNGIIDKIVDLKI